MKAFSKKVVEGSSFIPPEKCLAGFNQNFENVQDVEWFAKDNLFEALFYRDNLEHIAFFNPEGFLLEYRQNIAPGFLPEALKEYCLSRGEIRNAVLRNKGNLLEYEVIIAADDDKRLLLKLSDSGELINEANL